MRSLRTLVSCFALAATAFSITACSVSDTPTNAVNWTPVYVSVKYRDDPVDVGAPYFESLGDRSSSVVDAAWYDEGNEYLVIVLNGTPYHYCSLPAVVWSSLKTAPSVGSFYANSIKGRFDCRIFPVPDY